MTRLRVRAAVLRGVVAGESWDSLPDVRALCSELGGYGPLYSDRMGMLVNDILRGLYFGGSPAEAPRPHEGHLVVLRKYTAANSSEQVARDRASVVPRFGDSRRVAFNLAERFFDAAEAVLRAKAPAK